MTHIVIFADENFTFKNHLQIDTIKCYAYINGLQFHFFGFNKTPKCTHDNVLYRRHCLLAEIMENWRENDFVYAIDSDVIYHGNASEWYDPEENIDLVFYERFWTGEVTAGKSVNIVFLPNM